jgi:hypothetical protein
LEHFRLAAKPVPENVESGRRAASHRVASKGVYAGGGSIAEGKQPRKFPRWLQNGAL